MKLQAVSVTLLWNVLKIAPPYWVELGPLAELSLNEQFVSVMLQKVVLYMAAPRYAAWLFVNVQSANVGLLLPELCMPAALLRATLSTKEQLMKVAWLPWRFRTAAPDRPAKFSVNEQLRIVGLPLSFFMPAP